jgi:hypothetical protein
VIILAIFYGEMFRFDIIGSMVFCDLTTHSLVDRYRSQTPLYQTARYLQPESCSNRATYPPFYRYELPTVSFLPALPCLPFQLSLYGMTVEADA